MQAITRFVFLVLLGLFSAAALADPADHILERAYVVDESGKLTLDEIRQMPVQRYEGVLSRGFTESATWIRITVAPVQGIRSGEPLAVRVRPVYLDEIRLFDPLDTSGRVRIAGDRTEWHASEFKSLNHGFLIPASDAPREIWLRLKTTSTSLIHVQVLTMEEAQHANRIQEMVYGLMMGTLLLFFLWAVLQWFLQREVLMLAFTISQLTAIAYALVYVGYARLIGGEYFSAAVIDSFSCVVYCAYVVVGIVFHYFMMREFKPWMPGLRLMLAAGILAFVAEMVLMAVGSTMSAMRLNLTVVAVSPLLLATLSFTCRAWPAAAEDERPVIPKWMLVGFYSLLSVALVVATSPALGLAKGPEFNLHMFLIHGLMTGVILIVLLQLRAYRIEESRNRAYLRARSAAQQIELEKQKSQLQGRFMEMLAHEVKTSLSVLHMVFGVSRLNPEMLEHGRRTVNNINQLIERCLQAEKFDDDEIISHFENFSVEALIEDLLSKQPDRARISVEQDAPATVNSDWQIFKSVLSNLVDNGLKYSLPGSTILLKVKSAQLGERAGCEISVENLVQSGPGSTGFPDRDELFRKYYRADGARKHSGSGLGLYLVANFMRLLKGEVRYEPLEKSVRFTVWLPS
ncbi:HATPase domain containing protein [Oxalobacteraceae bacterium]